MSASMGVGDPFVFYALPFFAINGFAVTIWLAFRWRHFPETHKRLILLANCNLLGAAIARIPLDPVQAGAPFSFIFGPDLIIVAGMLYDWRSAGACIASGSSAAPWWWRARSR